MPVAPLGPNASNVETVALVGDPGVMPAPSPRIGTDLRGLMVAVKDIQIEQ
jgi:hypothetical protein